MVEEEIIFTVFARVLSKWCKNNVIAGAEANKKHVYNRFLFDIYRKGFIKMRDFLRTLGVKTLISDQNMNQSPLLSVLRSDYDYIDNHFYWDHPRFQGGRWGVGALGVTRRSFTGTQGMGLEYRTYQARRTQTTARIFRADVTQRRLQQARR